MSKTGLVRTKRFRWIVETVLKRRQERLVLNGVAGVLGVEGMSNFDEQ
ncbi:hypothetical protein [Bradyrhizobium sp. CCGUVB23]|nr:hypothetical protein [Bradyrhizobium sp. CCGUVB23]MCP3460595.1 hypothetical protein [Bradyrhizobium sp. CCGUVB23]